MREYALEIISILTFGGVIYIFTKATDAWSRRKDFFNKGHVSTTSRSASGEVRTLQPTRGGVTITPRNKIILSAVILALFFFAYLWYQNKKEKEWLCLQRIAYKSNYYRLDDEKRFKTQDEAMSYCFMEMDYVQ